MAKVHQKVRVGSNRPVAKSPKQVAVAYEKRQLPCMLTLTSEYLAYKASAAIRITRMDYGHSA